MGDERQESREKEEKQMREKGRSECNITLWISSCRARYWITSRTPPRSRFSCALRPAFCCSRDSRIPNSDKGDCGKRHVFKVRTMRKVLVVPAGCNCSGCVTQCFCAGKQHMMCMILLQETITSTYTQAKRRTCSWTWDVCVVRCV